MAAFSSPAFTIVSGGTPVRACLPKCERVQQLQAESERSQGAKARTAVLASATFTAAALRARRRPCRRRRLRGPVCRRAASDEEANEQLPSRDFSDPLAQALKGGPPLRLVPGGGLAFEVGEGQGASRVKWGVLKEAVDEASVDRSPEAESRRAELRATAATSLVNIDDEERARRRIAGLAFAAFAFVLSAYLLWTQAAWYSRAGVFPVIALAYGFLLSAEEGL
ncbi:unnamed protein product [Polarella glacialis]|uniref:Uncharacterized protein n=1 Tax=Polarella glacialis TaxID=89957 RepID=A0A813JN22_POLGL|nr:unnamed protein product [Polarella glacialis]CAE8682206.1 unnamed protein product [Polarella glacialis]